MIIAKSSNSMNLDRSVNTAAITKCPVIDLTTFYCPLCHDYTLTACQHTNDNCQSIPTSPSSVMVMRERLLEAIEKLGYFMISLPTATTKTTTVSDVHSVLLKARDIHHEVRAISHDFFRQPVEKKLQAVSIDRARRGYSPMSTENFASLVGNGNKPNDSVEKFRIGPLAGDRHAATTIDADANPVNAADVVPIEDVSNVDDPLQQLQAYYNTKQARIHFFPNDWRNVSQSFHGISQCYYETMYQLAMIILTIIESCCQLIPGSLTQEFDRDKHTSILCYNYYPSLPLSTASATNTTGASKVIERIAEHTDVSMFTIVTDLDREIIQENDVCLEIFNALQGNWEAVEYSEGMYLINIGDCLSERSRSRLKSALHRVVMRPSSSDRISSEQIADNGSSIVLSKERFSSAFFFAPNYNAKMTWLEINSSDQLKSSVPPLSEVVDYDTWRKQRVKRAMDMLKKGPSSQLAVSKGTTAIKKEGSDGKEPNSKKSQKKEKQALAKKSSKAQEEVENSRESSV